jgi:hypothetical protein
MNRILVILVSLSVSHLVSAQNTVGLISINPEIILPGYYLIYPHNQPNVYLLDQCGSIANVWEDESESRPGNTASLLPDGRLVKSKRNQFVVNDRIWAGGGGATIEIRSWDNTLEWSFTLNDSTARLHHDFEVLPNGNILAIAWEIKTEEEAIQAGRNPALLEDGEVWPDQILEINPALDSIVWEWHVWDHLIQDYDSTKSNFGIVKDHPELLDINFTNGAGANWMHSNAIDYHPGLDQIVIGSPFLNEIYIIDHSTSKSQASRHTGGLSGKGGDFMYRWGNPNSYRRGTSNEQTLFFQHDVHWLDDFADPQHPEFGKLAVFNNEFGNGFSAISIFQPPWDMYTWSYLIDTSRWGPFDYDKNFTHPDTFALYSSGLSSVQLLSNGNYLICSGRQGYSFVLTPQGEIVWEYVTPLKMGTAVIQGDTLKESDNLTFEMKFYPAEYSAFQDRVLMEGSYIELAPDTTFCDQISSLHELPLLDVLDVFPNPATEYIEVNWKNRYPDNLRLYNSIGELIITIPRNEAKTKINIDFLPSGVYFLANKSVVKKIMVH